MLNLKLRRWVFVKYVCMYIRVSFDHHIPKKMSSVNMQVIVPYFSSRQVADNTWSNKQFIVRSGKCREVQKYSVVTYWSFDCSYLGCLLLFPFDRNSIIYHFPGDTRSKTPILLYFQLCRMRWTKMFLNFYKVFLCFDNISHLLYANVFNLIDRVA